MPETTSIDWAKELTFVDGEAWPFTESPDCDITGYGHQDLKAFAAAINRWEDHCRGDLIPIPDEDRWTDEHVEHRWAQPVVMRDGDWTLRLADEDAEGAIPVTVLWGQR